MARKRLSDEQVGALLRRIFYDRDGPPLRVVAYDRVSTDGQIGGTSLDTQADDTAEWCERRGITIVRRYVEPGESGRYDTRPQFQAMLRDLELLDVQAVVVAAFDRFARDARLHLNAIELLREHGAVLVSIAEPIDYSTAEGKRRMTDDASSAQYYSDRLSERMQRACKHLAQRGLWLGPPPVGYARGDERAPLVATDDAPAVQLAFSLYATGLYSYTTLADALNRHGHTLPNIQLGRRVPFTKFTVRELLKQQAYIGKVVYRGETYSGQHEPLIDETTWRTVQDLLVKRGEKRGKTNLGQGYGLLTGIVFCETCGARMWQHNGHTKRPTYICSSHWRRTCKEATVHMRNLDAEAIELTRQLRLPPDLRAEVLETIAERHAARQQPAAAAVDTTALEGKLARLKELYLDGDIDKTTYQQRKSQLESQLAAAPVPAPAHAPLKLEEAAHLLDDLHRLIVNAPLPQQRQLMQQCFAAFWVTKNLGIVAIQPRDVYLPLVALTMMPRFDLVSRVGLEPTTN